VLDVGDVDDEVIETGNVEWHGIFSVWTGVCGDTAVRIERY
jgi:hypothetical protein